MSPSQILWMWLGHNWVYYPSMFDGSELLLEVFAPAPSLGMRGRFRFVLTDAKPVQISVGNEVAIDAGEGWDVELTLTSADLLGAAWVGAGLIQLFLSGRLRVRGDAHRMMRLPELFARLRNGSEPEKETIGSTSERRAALPRPSEAIAAGEPPILAIERRASISSDEFGREYVARGRPLILTRLDWPIMRLSRDELFERLRDLQGLVREGDYIGTAFSTDRAFRPVSLGEFLETLERVHDGLPPYVGNNPLPTALLELAPPPPLFPAKDYRHPSFWLGPAGTITPLHRDPEDNVFVQVWGEKSFILAAPDQRPYLSAWAASTSGALEGCDVDPENPAKYPDLSLARLVRCTVKAGEALFLPEGWFHHVRSLSPSMSINYWVDSRRD